MTEKVNSSYGIARLHASWATAQLEQVVKLIVIEGDAEPVTEIAKDFLGDKFTHWRHKIRVICTQHRNEADRSSARFAPEPWKDADVPRSPFDNEGRSQDLARNWAAARTSSTSPMRYSGLPGFVFAPRSDGNMRIMPA